MFFGIIPVLFGAMYGYTPVHKRSPGDLLKFGAIITPLMYIKIVNENLDEKLARGYLQRSKISPFLSPLILVPLATGWYFCIGSAMGRYALERLTAGDD